MHTKVKFDLPVRTRARLQIIHYVDAGCLWMVGNGHRKLAVRIWKITGLYGKE